MRRSDRQISDHLEIIEILNLGKVCHLALVDNNKPYIVAMNYGFLWDGNKLTFYFHCANSGKKLDLIKNNNIGCFFIDIDHELVRGEKSCDFGMKYKSVSGNGFLEIINDISEKQKGLNLLMKHYSNQTDFSYDEKVFSATTVLKMTITDFAAKKKS